MAIVIGQPQKTRKIGRLVTILILLAIVLLAAYYLFFAPTPGFDYIAPAPLERANQLSTFDLDPDSVFSSSQFQALQRYQVPPGTGTFGRANPFSF